MNLPGESQVSGIFGMDADVMIIALKHLKVECPEEKAFPEDLDDRL